MRCNFCIEVWSTQRHDIEVDLLPGTIHLAQEHLELVEIVVSRGCLYGFQIGIRVDIHPEGDSSRGMRHLRRRVEKVLEVMFDEVLGLGVLLHVLVVDTFREAERRRPFRRLQGDSLYTPSGIGHVSSDEALPFQGGVGVDFRIRTGRCR